MAARPEDKTRGWLDRVERIGNALPDPAFIFVALIVGLVIWSAISAAIGWSAVNPSSGERVFVQSLLSVDNVRKLLVGMPETFAQFPALGFVVVVMLGAAVAERSGLFTALISRAVRNLPTAYLTPCIYLVGVMSHHAADAAYVVLIPLAAIIYHQSGRHPLAGIAAAFAGISGAFAANLLPGQFDVLMMGITRAATQILVPDHPLNPLGNWYFTAALGVILLPVVWFVCDRIVEPRLARVAIVAPDEGLVASGDADATRQRTGFRRAGIVLIAVVAAFAALVLVPDYRPLVDEAASGPARMTPFYSALIAAFFLVFLGAGWAYGAAVGTVRSHRDVVAMMADGVRHLAPYVVIVFFAAHFVAMFGWSKLGFVIAINGAATLRDLALPTPLLLVALLLMSAVVDLFVGSASAKWTIMAPIVVPMLMLLGVSPEMTTATFRMGDSIFNIVTPVASNFVLVLIICQRWNKDFGVGSQIAMMLPFSIAIGITGVLLVTAWSALGLPVGPAAPAAYAVTSVLR